MIINHNLSAMNAQRQFKINTAATQKNIEKLSSGMRINRAGDDASGLAVSEKMRSQVRGLNQASRNAQDGISLIQTAEGWLNETHSVLQRMRELAVQSANGTYTYEDRLQIETEIKQLIDEVDRISSQAEFNTLKLLRGGFGRGEGAAPDAPAPAEGEANKMAMPRVIPPVKGELNSHTLIRAEGDNKGGVYIHVGANMDHREKIYIEDMSAAALGLSKTPADPQGVRQLSVSYTSQDGSNRAIQILDSAIYRVSKERANLGAFQNRLEGSIRGVDIASENLQSAESHIRDVDMASEMVDFVKNQILSQSSGSMLAQANMRPQIILRVLG